MIKLILNENEAMKNISNILKFAAFAAIVSVAFSCTREEIEAPAPSGEKFTLEVSLEPQLKTTLGASDGSGERKVYWSNGDKIAINGVASEALSGLADETQSTLFTFGETESAMISTPYNVVYPASIVTVSNYDNVTLPDVQTYKAGGFADGMSPMAGYSADGSSLSLKHLCAVLHISVKRSTEATADTDNIVAVRFKGKAGEQVCGSFAIDYSTATLTGNSSADADKEVRVAKSLATSTSTAVEYYLVVPAGTYTSGFEVIVQDANSHIMTKSKSASTTLVAGKVYNMAEFDFVPSGTETGIEIASAEDMIAFATAYNNNEYEALGSSLVATVTQDITFNDNTSAAFNATGGIGLKKSYYGDAVDYYFDGSFNGNNHTISGLAATIPLFKATSSSAKIIDFNIDNTSSFTFTHNNSAEMDHGSVVGYHRGTLKNVSVAADVTMSAGDVSKVTALGGLVGRVVVGSVENCIYSGNLTVPYEYVVSGQKTYVGGLVGEISNSEGKIEDSNFAGTIDFAGTVASTSKTDPYLLLGGIIGRNQGAISNCSVLATNTKTITMDNNKDYTATIQTHSRKVYYMAQGGVVGFNEGAVSGCTNNAFTQNFVLSNATQGGTASDDNSRYYNWGGIAGTNASSGSVSNCTNNAAIESRAVPRIQKIGGVVGYNTGSVTSCSNESTGSIYITTTNITPYSARVGEVGGVIGNNAGTVTDVSNAGNIRMDRSENNAGVEIKFGGVIGLTTTGIDGGASKNITNSGGISDEYNGTTVTTAGIRLGGIVGSAQASVKNVVNAGSITMKLSTANVMNKLYMGGIVGEVNSSANIEVSGCENSGEVYFNVNAKAAAHTGNYIGGIVGFFTTSDDVTASITNCENSGYIHSQCNGTTAVTGINLGGIVGKLDGSSDVSISSCNNNCSTGTEGKVHLLVGPNSDNNVGGILGYSATNVTISNSTNNGLATYQLNAVLENATINGCVGGIMGTLAADKTATISECTNNGKVFFDNNGKGGTKDKDSGKYTNTYSGGILAKGESVTLSECTNNGYVLGGNSIKHNGTSCYTGGIVAYLSGLSSISECINTADVYNDQFVNSSSNTINAFTGGIAAFVIGADGSPITISDCEHNTANLRSRRGYQGGIVGYANYVSISGSDNKATSLTGSAYYAGGVAGWVQNGSITNCDFTGTEIYSSQLQTNGGGGIAAKLDATTVDGCQSSVTEIYHTDTNGNRDANVAGGAIVGISGSGNTIQNCHYKATINSVAANIAGTGSFTDGGGNVADL